MGKYVIDTELFMVLESSIIIEAPWMWGGPGFYTWNGQDIPEKYTSIFWNSTGFSRDTLLKKMVDIYRDHPYRTVEIDDLPAEDVLALSSVRMLDNMEIADGYVFPVGRQL